MRLRESLQAVPAKSGRSGSDDDRHDDRFEVVLLQQKRQIGFVQSQGEVALFDLPQEIEQVPAVDGECERGRNARFGSDLRCCLVVFVAEAFEIDLVRVQRQFQIV